MAGNKKGLTPREVRPFGATAVEQLALSNLHERDLVGEVTQTLRDEQSEGGHNFRTGTLLVHELMRLLIGSGLEISDLAPVEHIIHSTAVEIAEDIRRSNILHLSPENPIVRTFVTNKLEHNAGKILALYFADIDNSDYLDVKYVNLASFIVALEKDLVADGFLTERAREITHALWRNIEADAELRLGLADEVQRTNAVRLTRLALQAAGASKDFNFAAPPASSHPAEASAHWMDRDRREFPTAESFLRHHYGSRLGIEGDLTLSEVGRYDTPLLTALDREFKGRRHELHVLLPTAKERADQRLLNKYGYIPQGRDRQSKLTMMRLERKPAP